MNATAFRDLVARMREAQRDYFRTRSVDALNRSKRLEREVDVELAGPPQGRLDLGEGGE